LQYGSAPGTVPESGNYEKKANRHHAHLSFGHPLQTTTPKCDSPLGVLKVNWRSELSVALPLGGQVRILAAIALLVMVGCSRQSQRFVPFVEDDTILALDTKTGQTCVSYKQASMPKGGTPMPYCVDLYNSK
jgi:hypothetical protein